MTLPLTPDTLRAAYDYLCTTPPFNRWNLPDSEDVVFKVVRDPGYRGWYRFLKKRHTVFISSACIGSTDGLMRVMAHEMVHVHEKHARACGSGQHSAAFYRWGAQVCRVHIFDSKEF